MSDSFDFTQFMAAVNNSINNNVQSQPEQPVSFICQTRDSQNPNITHMTESYNPNISHHNFSDNDN